MTTSVLKFGVAFGAAMLGSSFAAWCEDGNQAALLKAMSGAKVSLQQGIAQVAKGTEVPTEAKYEMEDGKLMLSIYTSAKGFNTPAEDNSFIEYSGDASAATWAPKKPGSWKPCFTTCECVMWRPKRLDETQVRKSFV